MHVVRVEIHPLPGEQNSNFSANINAQSSFEVKGLEESKIYWFESEKEIEKKELSKICEDILLDPVLEFYSIENENQDLIPTFDNAVEVRFKPGVTDNRAQAVKNAVDLVFDGKLSCNVYTGNLYFITGDLIQKQLIDLSEEFLLNKLLNDYHIYPLGDFNQDRFLKTNVPKVQIEKKKVEIINLSQSFDALLRLSEQRCWALNFEELKQIKDHFLNDKTQEMRRAKNLPMNPTDVEIEVIAQSWSEHCKHKIFAANIEYTENQNIKGKKLGNLNVESLYKSYIKKATHDIKEQRNLDWLISVFSDNAGIVRFDENLDLCIKVETHNSPSALDPYGGALTGILGVNRDILGTGIGALPIANTDVFCFAHSELVDKRGVKLPEGLKHPARILSGVHKGVEDGGNKSGIPTVNGAIIYDDDYAGKPLVYVGTVGVIPQKTKHYPDTSTKNQKSSDAIVVVGGKVGADGIHGATFSSLELNENSPATAVQIGDPFTQRKVTDFLIAARELGLYSSITDNGAGGLSSSIGEMACETNGAELDLSKVPLKYPGLSAFEIMISESQERMSFSVPVEHLDEFVSLAKTYNVEACELGQFTNSGYLEVFFEGETVGLLDLDFLHESLNPMNLKAHFENKNTSEERWHGAVVKKNIGENFFEEMLKKPNIHSKQYLVNQYDQEVKAATVVKPFNGSTQNAPSDAGVIWLKPHGGGDKNAVAIGNGIQPFYSHFDTYLMAQLSIDEAVRNIVATGADPDYTVLLDNFCWPDPIATTENPDGKYKLAQLVRANAALYDTALAYGMPFVSGKDSMKNDFRGQDEKGKNVKISVPPTLLITSMGRIKNVDKLLTSSFKRSDDLVYVLGDIPTDKFLYSEFTREYNINEEVHLPEVDLEKNLNLYRTIYKNTHLLESCHDISEGGLFCSLTESCFGEELGLELTIVSDELQFLFNESSGCFVISVNACNKEQFEAEFSGTFKFLGKTTNRNEVKFKDRILNLKTLKKAWRGL